MQVSVPSLPFDPNKAFQPNEPALQAAEAIDRYLQQGNGYRPQPQSTTLVDKPVKPAASSLR
jgi:hypothetical protein